jgi:deazaflavin-dependent oxidoreductase (nitroreductase family)
MRVFNKHVTNRVLRRLALLSRGPFAIVHHVGRKSGRHYETVIMVWPAGGQGLVIALTYGPHVDWYQNLLASGGGAVHWHGRDFAIGRPEPIEPQKALTSFPPPLRPILGRSGTHQFVLAPFTYPAGPEV